MITLEVPLDDPDLPLIEVLRVLLTATKEAHEQTGGKPGEFMHALKEITKELTHK